MTDTPQIDTSQGSSSGGQVNPESASSSGWLADNQRLVLLVALAVVLAVVAWRYRDLFEPAEPPADRDGEEIEELNDLVVEEDEDTGPTVEVPAAPDDELEKDAAVLEGLQASGKMQGVED